MFNQIEKIIPKSDYVLHAIFMDGTQKLYDVKPLMSQIPDFEDLRQIEGLFQLVHVDVGGYGIVWNSRLDLSSDEIFEHGITIDPASESAPLPDEAEAIAIANKSIAEEGTISHDSVGWD